MWFITVIVFVIIIYRLAYAELSLCFGDKVNLIMLYNSFDVQQFESKSIRYIGLQFSFFVHFVFAWFKHQILQMFGSDSIPILLIVKEGQLQFFFESLVKFSCESIWPSRLGIFFRKAFCYYLNFLICYDLLWVCLGCWSLFFLICG